MCGIVGFVCQETSPNLIGIGKALDSMALRGPDDCGVWQDQHVALGHRRLSITGIENGKQPITSPDGSIVVVVNGEFYDFERLKPILSRDYNFQTDSNSELLIPLYLKHGCFGMMEHLRGEFAFILYDSRLRQVVAGRDRFGIKPLCWYADDEKIILASKAKAILACGIEAKWDEYSLMQALSIQYQPTNRTFIKGIHQLQPGHLLISQPNSGIKDIAYWDINYPADTEEQKITESQEKHFIDEFHDLLYESVQLRLRSDVPLCCHLSGGLDSSSVAGIMTHISDRPVHCFSIVFPYADGEYDEERFAAETVDKCGAVLHKVEVSQHDILMALPDAVFHSEGLAVNGHISCKYLLNKAINKAGFKVALTGEGADECLAGYPHLRKDIFDLLPLSEKEWLTKKLYNSNLAITGTEIAVGDTLDCTNLLQKIGFVPSFLAAKASIGYKMYALLNNDIRQRCRCHDFLAELADSHLAASRLLGLHPVNKSLYLWNKHALCNYILATLGDGCEMAASVEGRLPFLDHKLFEMAAKLPIQMKIKDYTNEKYILKEAARPYITDNIYRRQKHPFQAPPLTRYLSAQPTTNHGNSDFSQIHDELTSTRFSSMGLFDKNAVASLIEALPSMDILGQTAYEPVVMLMLTIYYMDKTIMHGD